MKTSLSLLTCLACGVLSAATPRDAVKILSTSPLRFEPAADGDSARFVARGSRFRFSFQGSQADLQAGGKNVRLRFDGAAPSARIQAVEKLRSTTSVFLGNDPAQWRTSVPNYARLQVRELYRGVDLVYYGSAGELEYDLTVRPGADPGQIRLRFNGGHARVDREGNLIAGIIQKRPVAYQFGANGARIPVDSRYRKNADGSYGFALGSYDHERELVIDPVLTLSTYLSGSSQDVAGAIGHDAIGFLYVAGTTQSSDFPMVGNSLQATYGGAGDIFLVKIDPNAAPGTEVVYSTYIGGTGAEVFGGMAVGPQGDVYLTGTTASSDFPLANAAQTTGGTLNDAFVVWIDSTQTLAYSSYLGGAGADFGTGITFNSKGQIFVTGGTQSDDFPMAGGFQSSRAGGQDAFAAVIDPSLSGSGTLIYSTFLGGSGWDIGRGIAIAPDGTFWVVGGTYSGDFPVAGPSYQPAYQSGGDGFAVQINPALGSSSLVYSTFIGGTSEDEARNVIVDPSGRVIVSGWTLSPDLPITLNNAMQTQYGGNTDVFISIFNTANPPATQLVYSTFFGGSNGDVAFDMKRDAAGNLYLSGLTLSAGLPASANALQSSYDASMDAFALKFNPAIAGAASVSYFSYLGSGGLQVAYGIDFDATGKIFLAGFTSGHIFDAFGGTAKPSSAGNADGFVIGFSTTK